MHSAIPSAMLNNTIQKNGENLCQLADYLLHNRGPILSQWKARALGDAELETSKSLSRREFLDHVPQVLDVFDKELRRSRADLRVSKIRSESRQFEIHGLSRWQQGFSFTELVRDWNHLRCAILQSITQGAEEKPDWAGETFAAAVNLLSDLISEGINQSVAKYEEIRQAEARSRAIDLRNTINDLREIGSRQTELYQDASHDLFGHLGILSSITNVFHSRTKNQELTKLYEPLSQGLGVAMEILEDVKLQATLEAGQSKLFVETIDLVGCMRDTLAPYLMLAKEKSIDLEIAGPRCLEIETDAAKLTRIIQNLMHNALKFTSKGSIKVEWGLCSNTSHCFVSIENRCKPCPTPSSLPIGTQMVQASFASSAPSHKSNPNADKARAIPTLEGDDRSEETRQTRADPLANSREGLGLSIAKRLANLLSGRIDIEKDNEMHGARATLTVPVAQEPAR